MSKAPTPSCDDTPWGELNADDAIGQILDAITPVAEHHRVALTDALGHVIAEDIISPIDVPGHRNSAVDGYALIGDELSEGTEFQIAGRSLAGHPFKDPVKPGFCVAITTGAVMPDDADTVIMQEHTETVGDRIVIQRPCRTGDNVRQAGEDIRAGSVVGAASERLTPPLMGVLASVGVDTVETYRRPKVTLFSTGDEICEPGEPLRRGSVYDSNRYSLRGMLTDMGIQLQDLGLIGDDPEAIRQALVTASGTSDAIITSGGVSVGEADYIKDILAELGQMNFWKLAIKPGRPLTFGKIGDSVFFGLPGNPVAAMVTFLQFVRPALDRLAGSKPRPALRLRAVCVDRLRKRPGRREFQRAILRQAPSGELQVGLTGRQGSGVLTSMRLANCLIVLPESQETLEAGTEVTVELLPWASIETIETL